MRVSVSDAKAQLTDLVRRAEAGDDVIITPRGLPAVRLVPVTRKASADDKRRLLEALRGAAKGKPGLEGVSAADIDKFLYDEDGLPA